MTNDEEFDQLESGLAETLAGIEGIEIDSSDLGKMLLEFNQEREHEGASVDEFLQYLQGQGVINDSVYRRANTLVSVTLGSISLEALPKSESVYNVRGVIGQGGMGEIRIGRDRHLDRRVALKYLKPDMVNDRIVSRFIQEAQVSAKLEHPNIIPVYSFHGEDDGRLAFSMKLVTGRDLQELINDLQVEVRKGGEKAASLSLNRRLDLFLNVCDAMAYAHDKGVLHRDLKPANVMVGEFNEVYVMDWGLAKINGQKEDDRDTGLWDAQLDRIEQLDESAQTRVGSVIGTPMFMPPEQARGELEDLDPRADLYSLGVILFELVTLKHRFDGTKLRQLMVQVVAGQTQPVTHVDGITPINHELVAIIEKATALDREDRYDSVAAFGADLRHFRSNQETAASPDSGTRKITRWMEHNRTTTLGLLLAVVLVAAASVIWSLVQQNQTVLEHQLQTQQLVQFHSRVTNRAMRIDALGTGVIVQADQLAQSVNYLVRNGKETETKFYASADYASPTTAPADFRVRQVYGMKISIDHPVYKLAPGTTEEEVATTLRRLTPISRLFRSGFVRSTRNLDGDIDADQLIAEDGAPVRWAYIGLESGLFVSYPGKGGYPESYDPRERPWYKFGKTLKSGGSCGKGYVDSQGQGTVIPCVAPIRAPDGTFMGVAGYEFTLDYLLTDIIIPDGPTETTYLVSPEGLIRTQSGERQSYERGELRQGNEMQPFPNEKVRKMVQDQKSGHFVALEGGRKWVYTVVQLPTQPGAYVERAGFRSIMKWDGKSH